MAWRAQVVGRNWNGLPDNPCRVKRIPSPIPARVWYLRPPVIAAMGGLLPFGSIFIEMYFIFTSFWNYKARARPPCRPPSAAAAGASRRPAGACMRHPACLTVLHPAGPPAPAGLRLTWQRARAQVYYVYGFMLLVFLILAIVTVCVTIVGTYFLLNAENYHWQWTSFCAAASTALCAPVPRPWRDHGPFSSRLWHAACTSCLRLPAVKRLVRRGPDMLRNQAEVRLPCVLQVCVPVRGALLLREDQDDGLLPDLLLLWLHAHVLPGPGHHDGRAGLPGQRRVRAQDISQHQVRLIAGFEGASCSQVCLCWCRSLRVEGSLPAAAAYMVRSVASAQQMKADRSV